MIINPQDKVTNLVTRIRIWNNYLFLNLPEKNDGFIKLVKGHGYSWDRSQTAWYRSLPKRAGDPIDLAAEIGVVLLSTGYPVEFEDPQAQQRALEGSYKPETTRWILRRDDGQYTGWLNIIWGKKEDFYKDACSLRGARYNPPGIVVPADNFDEVEDFADVNDFSISEVAQQAIAEAKERQKNALVFDGSLPKKKEKKKNAAPTGKIADELLDEPL